MSNETQLMDQTVLIPPASRLAISSLAPNSTDWRSLSLAELGARFEVAGLRRYRAHQLFHWLHAEGATRWDEMTDLPEELRSRLASEGTLTTITVEHMQRSSDGTRKLRLRLPEGGLVESVLIPEEDRLTLCVSSQVGCALDCRFCATATMGLTRNMTTGEIVEQVWRARAMLAADERISNLVFMGMGEPLHNYEAVVRALGILLHPKAGGFSPRRITLSTAGLVPAILRYAQEPERVNLAISLNATTDDVRDTIMPINRKWNLERLLAAARAFPRGPRQWVTIEYVLLAGVNDSLDDARRLPKLLHGLRCKVNLIPWNPFPGSPYKRPSEAVVLRFHAALREAGFWVFVRKPKGVDIDAACGQLAARV